MRFDHIGLVVKRIERGRSTLSGILDIRDWTHELCDPVNGVRIQFGRDPSGICYELLEPLDEQSPVFPALNSGRAILNHVAYRVSALTEAADHLKLKGCARTSDPKPALAYAGRRIQFFVTPLRFLIELIEAPDHEHQFLRPFG
jgi:methylmalonyl-CoA/ethylmalonyl-CoA epimerase